MNASNNPQKMLNDAQATAKTLPDLSYPPHSIVLASETNNQGLDSLLVPSNTTRLSLEGDLILDPLPKAILKKPRSENLNHVALPTEFSPLHLRPTASSASPVPRPGIVHWNTCGTRSPRTITYGSYHLPPGCAPLQPAVVPYLLKPLPNMPAIILHPNPSVDSISTITSTTVMRRPAPGSSQTADATHTPTKGLLPQGHSLPPIYLVTPPPCPFRTHRPHGPTPERIHPPSWKNVLTGFQDLKPELTHEQLNSPFTWLSPLKITNDDIERVEFAWQYYGAVWIVTFDLSLVQELLNPGSPILFGRRPPKNLRYHLTRVCFVFKDIVHVEAVAYNDEGCFYPKTSKEWPPIILCLPRKKLAGFGLQISKAEAEQARMRVDTSLDSAWKFWLHPLFNRPTPIDPREYYTPKPRII